MAEQLQYDFVDAAEVIKFDDTGSCLMMRREKTSGSLLKIIRSISWILVQMKRGSCDLLERWIHHWRLASTAKADL